MITRMYANNYRCLVAFEAKFDSLGVLCGPNGAGKSSVFDALRVVRDLATGDVTTEQAIGYPDHTNWLDSNVVEFELDLQVKGDEFRYALQIEQIAEYAKPIIVLERATCNKKLLFERDVQGVRLVRAGGTQAGFPLDLRQSALGSIQPAQDQKEIAVLQQALNRVLILRPDPLGMEAESKRACNRPDLQLENLTSWYRNLYLTQEWSDHLRDALQTVWPDFRSFRLISTGLQAMILQLRFESLGSPESGTLSFAQLSDGEKMLVGLYMTRSALVAGSVQTLLIDEPDNFVGLSELQPWIISLMEVLGNDTQAIVISHHPEILNTAGEQFGHYLWRDNHTSPTRIGPLRTVKGLSIGEAIARGWVTNA